MPLKLRKWEDVEREVFTPEEIRAMDEWVRKELEELDLKAVRQRVGRSQKDLAAKVGMDQTTLSKMESRQDHRISTLRRLVEGLGGRLTVLVEFDDHIYRLKGPPKKARKKRKAA